MLCGEFMKKRGSKGVEGVNIEKNMFMPFLGFLKSGMANIK